MKPQLNHTKFGLITIDGQAYSYDVLIRLDGSIEKRKKRLSKEIYGTSHTISLAEAEHIFEKGARLLILGAGQYGMVTLSDAATEFFLTQDCDVLRLTTPEALDVWNNAQGEVIGLFHITC